MALLLGSGNYLVAQTDFALTGSLSQSRIDLITKYVSGFPDNTQLAIALITDNNVSYFGLKKVNGNLLPINNRDSVFEIGSVTKLFTSTILANLIKENVLNLNDPIENVLPYKLKPSVKDGSLITFKTLSNHTSGLPRMPENYVTGYDSVLLRDYLQKQLFIAQTKVNSSLCEAPFLEMALIKGWGTNRNDSIRLYAKSGNGIIGVWQKQISGRTVTRTFMPDNKVQSDFSGDPEIDIWGYYQLKGNEVKFRDIGGAACNNPGLYSFNIIDDELTFKLINDNCDGRSNGLSGIWTRKK